ncbi:hypothetical protein SPBRAN_370 [uncultured Candidatus Thioglobus sp.]|nr:hypothetical protein SPBRAN_370 [uncultured Candidatus Thioglobus sp.]
MIAGKISATLNGNNKMVDFELYHKNERNRLILKGALGLFQMEIKQSDQGLLVDGKLMKLSLAKWMRFKFGWHFPISELENIIFKHHISTLEKWQIKISKYQVINTITYPKLIRLQHTRNPIKIKLLIRQLNQGV